MHIMRKIDPASCLLDFILNELYKLLAMGQSFTVGSR